MHDLIESAVLHREFPTLKHAWDAREVGDHLEKALFDARRQPCKIACCELRQAAYIPGQGCILRYRLGIDDPGNSRKLEWLVTGRVFGTEQACEAYVAERLAPLERLAAGRPTPLPFACPVAAVPRLRMSVSAFPIDGELPALIDATDERRMTGILREALPKPMLQPASAETCRIEVVNYRHQHRATLRYLLGETVVYGKLTADSSGAIAEPVTAALRRRLRQSGSAFHIPDAFAWIPELGLSLLGAIPGRPGIERALKARLRGSPAPGDSMPLEKMIESAAQIAAVIHGMDLRPGPRRTLNGEFMWLAERIVEVRRLTPDLGDELQRRLGRLAAAAKGPAHDAVLCYGDFAIGQLLQEAGESGLVDFDSFCEGERALDLGQFLAYLRLGAMEVAAPQSGVLAGELGEGFLDEYIAASGAELDRRRLSDRVAVYKVVSLLRRAIRSWQKFKPRRVEAALAALEQDDLSR